MSMIHSGDIPAPVSHWGPNRSRISWGAVFAGAVVAVATTLLLSLLGAAIGAGSIHPLDTNSTDVARYGAGAAIWQIINLAISMAFGGYVAARLSGTHSHLDGELHGVTMWGVAVLLGSVLLAQAVSGLVGMVTQGAGSVVSRSVGGGGAGTVSGVLPREVSPQAVIDRLQLSLSSSGDPTTMNHEQIGAEIAAIVRGSLFNGSVSEADRTRLVALVAAQSGITKDEAARRVTRMEDDIKASLAQVEQRARVAADEVAHNAATAARALFTALVIGLLAALVGAWIGTRHKRVLHPVVEHAHAPTIVPTHTVYERHEPSSVSVYDDTGHLVSQYLRGVSFPVSKQDLLRLARSHNAGSSLLHSIEGLAERSYSNTEDVLRALGLSVTH